MYSVSTFEREYVILEKRQDKFCGEENLEEKSRTIFNDT